METRYLRNMWNNKRITDDDDDDNDDIVAAIALAGLSPKSFVFRTQAVMCFTWLHMFRCICFCFSLCLCILLCPLLCSPFSHLTAF